MTTIDTIQQMYTLWDGTEEHAAEILRWIHLIVEREKMRNTDDRQLMDYLNKNPSN